MRNMYVLLCTERRFAHSSLSTPFSGALSIAVDLSVYWGSGWLRLTLKMSRAGSPDVFFLLKIFCKTLFIKFSF